MIGSKLVNRYQILERIGGGGMAVVYKARCTLLNRIVAVKILRQQYSIDEDFVRRFRREAQAAASLSHPNIVSIYDVGQDKETYFIVMEYVEGETLKDLIEREAPLEPARAVSIVRQIANALYHAHNNKIIHRDIKPHNVLISKDGRVKVADFGIARAVTSTTQTFSPNSIMGSVHYFSPEQAKGKLATEQSDLYSLGIVFYEMLTKKLPFDGESPISIALKHLQQTIPPASQYNLNVTPKLQGILDKMLEKDRSLRYQNATELLAALRTWNVPGEDTAATNESENELDQESQHTQIYTPVNPDKKPLKTWQRLLLKWGIIFILLAGAVYLGIVGFRALGELWRVDEVQVPAVTEMSLEEAIAALEEAGLKNYQVVGHVHHETIPENHVVIQKPGARQTVKENRLIELTVSKGPDLVEVPALEGKEVREAESELESLGLIPEREYEFSEKFGSGIVIRQDPDSGKIPRGEKVKLVVSQGPRPIIMEDLRGKTLEEARQIIAQLLLSERLLRWEPLQGDSPGGIVTSHIPEAKTEVAPGDSVDLWLRPYNKISKTVNISQLNPGDQVRIEVTDITGVTQVPFDDVVWEESFSLTVSGWERGTIVVYINGAKKEESPF